MTARRAAAPEDAMTDGERSLGNRMQAEPAFKRWHAGRKQGRDAALREWCALYAETGAGVSDEKRALVPAVSWNTVRRWIRNHAESGFEGLLPGKGGRISDMDRDPEMRDFVEALIYHNPKVTASRIQKALAARYPDRKTPGIASVRRWVRKWRKENAYALSLLADPVGHRRRTMPAFGSESEPIKAHRRRHTRWCMVAGDPRKRWPHRSWADSRQVVGAAHREWLFAAAGIEGATFTVLAGEREAMRVTFSGGYFHYAYPCEEAACDLYPGRINRSIIMPRDA